MENINKLIKGISVFLLYILVPYVLNMFLPSITESTVIELLYRFIFMFLLLLLFVLIYKDDIIRDIKAFKEKPSRVIKTSIIYFLCLIGGIMVISSLIYLVYPDFSYTNSGLIDSLFEENFFIMIIYVFFLTLFTEQIVFRKVFRDIIKNKYFFIIFSGLIYGIFQIGYVVSDVNDLLTVIPFAYAGMILSSSMEKTDNIITPCLVYMFYDLFLLSGILMGI